MDREIFETRSAALRPKLHRFCARMSRSVVDGEDRVQDTLARALDRLDTLRDDDHLEAWLFRIAYTTCLNARRSERDEVELLDDDDGVEPEDPVERTEALGSALATLVVRLPTKERAALILKDVLDYSLEEVAEIIDSTVGGTKAALHRARKKLRNAEPAPAVDLPHRDLVAAYLDRFNRRDWPGVLALIRADVEVSVVGEARGVGHGFLDGNYFHNYGRLPFEWRFEIREVDGSPLAVLYRRDGDDWIASSVLVLEFEDGVVARVRDYIHVEYLLAEASVE